MGAGESIKKALSSGVKKGGVGATHRRLIRLGIRKATGNKTSKLLEDPKTEAALEFISAFGMMAALDLDREGRVPGREALYGIAKASMDDAVRHGSGQLIDDAVNILSPFFKELEEAVNVLALEDKVAVEAQETERVEEVLRAAKGQSTKTTSKA